MPALPLHQFSIAASSLVLQFCGITKYYTINDLEQHKSVFQFWVSEVWCKSYRAKIKVLTALYPLWRL